MDYLLFARIGDYHVLLPAGEDPLAFSSDSTVFLSRETMQAIAGIEGNYMLKEELAPHIGDSRCLTGTHYAFRQYDRFAVIMPVATMRRSSARLDRQFDAIAAAAAQRITSFQLATKRRLIADLFAEPNALGSYVEAWCRYVFCDHFSLWIYNRYSEVFTCSTASFKYDRSYIYRSEGSSLNEVLDPSYEYECRPPRADRMNFEQTREMQTLNRLKLDLGFDGTIGVVSFYSRFPSFDLHPENRAEIRNSIETKYLQVRQQARQSMIEINQHFIETYRTGELTQFLHRIVAEVCDSFQCEACSIFLHDAGSNQLYLAAIADNRHDGPPSEVATYEVTDDAFTAKVFNERRMQFSYDLGKDEADARFFAEATALEATNWIGVPLHYGDIGLGVLRVRNKFEPAEDGEMRTIDFRNSDFANLLALASNLSNLIRIELLFNETAAKLDETNASVLEMQDFNKVFLHEIRTPISKFTMAPEIIKRTLRNPRLSEENLEKVMRQLDDIQVMGDRLEFIAKTFNFNQIVTRRNFETLSVLRDIIYPVINITRGYLQKQYDIDIQVEHTGLKSCRVHGDKTLLNIVFNTLIDNAGKYSIDTNHPISVSGGYETSGDFFDIAVSNYGLPIYEDELESLYEKGARGRESRRHGIGGTGIGLHLANRIMVEAGGALTLTSLRDPVTFTIRIPTRAGGEEP